MMSLETVRLSIRLFRTADAKEIFQLSQEEELARWIPSQVYESEKHSRKVLSHLISQYEETIDPSLRPYVLAVVDRESNEVIGHVGLSPLACDVEIGYAIGEKQSGKGLATEAVAVVSQWALKELYLSKIYGVVESKNIRSCRVLEKAGYDLLKESEQMHQGRLCICKTFVCRPS